MPRLPTAHQDLGSPERPRSQNVVPIQLGRAEAAQVQSGQALSDLGRTVTDAALRIADRQDKMEYVKQKSTFLQEMVRAESEIGSEDDTDYKTFGPRFQDRLAKTKNEALGKIRNTSIRNQLEADIDLDIEQGLSRMAKKSWGLEVENALADFQSTTVQNRELFLQSKSPAVRQSIMDDQQKYIAVLTENRYIDKTKAGELSRQVAEDYAIGRLTILPPEQAVRELRSGAVDSMIPGDKRDALIEKFESESIGNLKNQEWINQQAREGIFNQYSLAVEQTGSLKDIPPQDWAAMDKSQRESLKSYAKNIAEGNQVPTDWDTYYKLKTQAADPASRKAFEREDLTKYRNKLGTDEYKELIGLQAGIREGKKDKALDGFRTHNQIINDTLNSIGIDSSEVANFRRMVDERVQARQEVAGKEVTNEEVQQIADNLIVKGKVPGSGFFFDDEKRRFQLEADETIVVEDAVEVPRAERQKIEDALRRRGSPVNDDTVLELYNRKLSRE